MWGKQQGKMPNEKVKIHRGELRREHISYRTQKTQARARESWRQRLTHDLWHRVQIQRRGQRINRETKAPQLHPHPRVQFQV